jgi:hypothetical protein
MRFAICIAILVLVGLVGEGSAELKIFSIPGDISWSEAQQGPISEQRFLEVIDLQRASDGIAPIEPIRVVPVPLLEEIEAVDAVIDSILFEFSQNVARVDVVAIERAVVGDRTVEPGQVLIPRWTSFPRGLENVQLLHLAGIDSIEAMINVANSFPRPPSGDKYNKGLNLTTLGIFERALTSQRLQEGLGRVFDGDPLTHFERIDRVGQDVKQIWTLYIDLGRFFPVRLVRMYPSPETPVRISAFTFFRGIAGTERNVAGLSLDDPKVGQLAFPVFTKIAPTFPNFVPEQSVPVNVEDTVSVIFDPPAKLRYSRLDFQTQLDYDLGEMEFFSDGFVPEASYISNALSLPPATLGRIFWDEEKIGDPTKSSAVVRVQTGVNAEPDVLFRVNEFEREVEWKPEGAIAIDRRAGSRTLGDEIDLNDPEFNLEVREVFSALLPEERQAVRITRAEYQSLPGNVRRKIEPDLEFWSGVQQATNGQLINSPSGRPFIQIQVEFNSSSPESATLLRNLRFEYSAPQITDFVAGEIAPAVDVVAGRDTTFVMALEASLGGANNGFNRIQIFTPARIEAVEAVSVDIGEGVVQHLTRSDAGEIEEGQFRELHIADDQFVLGFPAIGPRDDGQDRKAVVKVNFRARVIDFRTNFSANVFLDTLGIGLDRLFTNNGILAIGETADTLALFLPQPVAGDDVVDFSITEQLSDRNSLAVLADISSQGKNLVANFSAEPNPFTPNGDGINDDLGVVFDVQRLLTPRPVYLEIYDLNGLRVRLIERVVSSGGYSEVWNGRNDSGEVVAPGLYILRISTKADDASDARTRLISVAY